MGIVNSVVIDHTARPARRRVSLTKGVDLTKRTTLRADEAVRSFPRPAGRISLAR